MTRLASILREQRTTYTAVAERAHLQARTVRQLASGETPLDNATVGTVRRIASALSLPVSALLEPELAHPGDSSLPRGARLSAAIREVMWAGTQAPYPSPLEQHGPDEIAAVPPDTFFADMPAIDDHRG
ncbi:MAG: hypothetical protein ABIG85_05665 [Chloroflexota bacterium]